MKISDIVEHLQEKYHPNDEIVIAWWDRDLFPKYDPDKDDDIPLSKEEWTRALELMARDSSSWADNISEKMYDFIKYYTDKATEQLTEENNK